MAFSEGYQTIYNDDGSVTHISVEHQPYVEPMSTTATLLILGSGTVLAVVVAAAPFAFDWMSERRSNKKRLATRQKENQEIFARLKPA